MVAVAGAFATISKEAPARGKTVGSPIAVVEVEEVIDGAAVAEAAGAVLGHALISKREIALAERAADFHMMAKVVVVVVAAATAVLEAVAEEEAVCAMTFNAGNVLGDLRAASRMRREPVIVVEAVDGVDRRTLIEVLVAHQTLLALVSALISRKVDVPGKLAAFPMRKEALLALVVDAVEEEEEEEAMVRVVFASPGKKENAHGEMIAALPMLEKGIFF